MNLATFVSLIGEVPQLLTIVDQAVVSVENSLNTFTGSQKLAAAEAKVNGWLTTANADVAKFGDLSSTITGLVNTAVNVFNVANAFTHKPAAPTPPAA